MSKYSQSEDDVKKWTHFKNDGHFWFTAHEDAGKF